ncbi:hypothetical protein IIA79_03060 [bacterium]|nr:hypothetical protein [bacterium]
MFDPLHPAVVWVWIPLTALAIPIVRSMIGPIMQRQRIAERKEARKTYERIVMEKLEVMKTALTMGMGKDDLAELDERLEKLIGADN